MPHGYRAMNGSLGGCAFKTNLVQGRDRLFQLEPGTRLNQNGAIVDFVLVGLRCQFHRRNACLSFQRLLHFGPAAVWARHGRHRQGDGFDFHRVASLR